MDSAIGWGKANLTVTDAELGYQQFANRQVQKTAEELAAERVAWDQRETTRIAGL